MLPTASFVVFFFGPPLAPYLIFNWYRSYTFFFWTRFLSAMLFFHSLTILLALGHSGRVVPNKGRVTCHSGGADVAFAPCLVLRSGYTFPPLLVLSFNDDCGSLCFFGWPFFFLQLFGSFAFFLFLFFSGVHGWPFRNHNPSRFCLLFSVSSELVQGALFAALFTVLFFSAGREALHGALLLGFRPRPAFSFSFLVVTFREEAARGEVLSFHKVRAGHTPVGPVPAFSPGPDITMDELFLSKIPQFFQSIPAPTSPFSSS